MFIVHVLRHAQRTIEYVVRWRLMDTTFRIGAGIDTRHETGGWHQQQAFLRMGHADPGKVQGTEAALRAELVNHIPDRLECGVRWRIKKSETLAHVGTVGQQCQLYY